MKAVISSTYDSKYLFFLPITTFLWNNLGVDVVCFMPSINFNTQEDANKYFLAQNAILSFNGKQSTYWFDCPKHKEATYAQCSRLYGACLDLPEDECLVVGDVDMGVFGREFGYLDDGRIHSVGHDLIDVDEMKQLPMCYLAMQVKDWKKIMDINNRSYQNCLDDLVGVIECEHFRGNQWGLDQFTAYSQFKKHGINPVIHRRAKLPERFATRRMDRDNMFWRENVNESLIDAHFWRPGYTDENFANIMELMTTMYPNDDFSWLVNYRNEYLKLL